MIFEHYDPTDDGPEVHICWALKLNAICIDEAIHDLEIQIQRRINE